jgi:glycosyltransferase involved in cell wall biosynthesis
MKIMVLLSTWNGEKYVKEQLASILAQQVDGTVEVLVRDDGSCDDTVRIVEEINDGRIRIIHGENLGTRGSFMALIGEAARGDADYIAFADQDDFWLPNKLQRATSKLSELTCPALYCSALNLVDEQLRSLGIYRFVDVPSFEASFLTNCATGCTCVINRDMLDLLAVTPIVDKILMHDWWLYLVATTFGSVVYDDEPYILYRQHAMNQVGMRTGLASLLYRTRLFLRRRPTPSRLTQAREFQRIYVHRLSARNERYLRQLVACEGRAFARLRFVFTQRPQRRVILEEVVSLITFLFGRY